MVSTTPITFHPLGAVISGAELRQLRTTDLRLSQRQLGLALGVTPATISNWNSPRAYPSPVRCSCSSWSACGSRMSSADSCYGGRSANDHRENPPTSRR